MRLISAVSGVQIPAPPPSSSFLPVLPHMNSLKETVRRAIVKHGMLARGDKVLCAVSGGPDSVAMLHVLSELAPELGVTLAVCHFDHGLRADSHEDAAFVSGMCDAMGIECVTERVELAALLKGRHVNKQAAAREYRYAFFDRAADGLGANKIAVGHTADDQAETYLMRELRGSGAQGLSAIPPVRGAIVRPLIEASRADIMEYIDAKGIPYRTDPTNLTTVYGRNRLRLTLMPLLKEYNPRAASAFIRNAEILRAEDDYLDSVVSGTLESIIKCAPTPTPPLRVGTGLSVNSSVEIDISGFSLLHTALKRRVIREAYRRVKGDLLGLTYAHVLEAEDSIATGETGRGVDLPGGVRVERSYDRLVFVMRGKAPQRGFSYMLPLPGEVSVPELGVIVMTWFTEEMEDPPEPKGHLARFDATKLNGPLVIRSRRPGDSFHPVGMTGSKKLQDYFTDMKLPRDGRDLVPILECGGEVAWVVGMRQDRRFAADDSTKRFIVIELINPAAAPDAFS